MHVGGRGAARASCTSAGGRRSASRCSTGSARPRRTTSTSRTGPAACGPGAPGELVPGYEAHVAESGELSIEGDTAALLYWNEHEKSKADVRGDTVRTGDLFERDEDGYFCYRGRADDLLKVGGIWVAPAEIEHCLLAHPDVVECAVVGKEQEGLTVACAYVVLRRAADGCRAPGLRARAALRRTRYPRDDRFVDELPKTPSGKIDRRALRA